MSTHSIDISALHEMGCTAVNITSASRTADTASLTFSLETLENSIAWAFGDMVTITDGGNVLFRGYVTTEPEVAVDAGGTTCRVQLENIVALVAATPYEQDQALTPYVRNTERLVNAADIIDKMMGEGQVEPGGNVAEGGWRIEFNPMIKCPAGSGSQTCWSFIEACLHWVPNAVTWYNPAARMLTFRSADEGTALNIDTDSGEVWLGGARAFTFTGCESASFRARHDLCPPVVGLVWEGSARRAVFPDGYSLREPWAFMYQIPKMAGAANSGDLTPEEAQRVQRAAQNSMLVQGIKVPDGWQVVAEGHPVDMKDTAPGAPANWHNFWKGFTAFRALSKTSVGCLAYGQAVFEPVPVDEAFPPGVLAEDNEQPANYEPFTQGDDVKIYVLAQGQFPASSKTRDNVSGLKFCKGKLRQYVWLDGTYAGTLSHEEYLAFFDGAFKVKDGDSTANTRYTILELDAVFINRRRKKYQVGTNALDPTDEDYKEDGGGSGSDSSTPTSQDYTNAARDYYNATRKLYYDGSITLRGVEGYSPDKLDGANLNVLGLRSEWSRMDTPVVQAEYDPQHKTLTISTGSPEILSIDERVQRTLLGRQTAFMAGTSMQEMPASFDDGEDDGSSGDSESGYPMVSPSMSAQTVATKGGRPLNPFQLFSEGTGENTRWFINEGTLAAPGGRVVSFETTDITELKTRYSDHKFTVRVERSTGLSEWVAVVRHYKKN